MGEDSKDKGMRKVRSVMAMSDLHLGRDISYLCSEDARFHGNRAALRELLTEAGPQDDAGRAGNH